MRGVGRDPIRGGHYGQRSCEPHQKAEHMAAPTNAANVKKALANPEPSTHEPHQKAEHMAAPTNAANVKKALANPEPSTHGTNRTSRAGLTMSVVRVRPEVAGRLSKRRTRSEHRGANSSIWAARISDTKCVPHSGKNPRDGVVVDDPCAELNIRRHDAACAGGDHMDDIAIVLSCLDGASLHLSADLVAFQNETTTILIRILREGKAFPLLHEDLYTPKRP